MNAVATRAVVGATSVAVLVAAVARFTHGHGEVITHHLRRGIHTGLTIQTVCAGVLATVFVGLFELNVLHWRRRARLSADQRAREDEETRQDVGEW